MFQRKLVKSGLSSHVIALPKEFVEDNKLTAGDTLTIERIKPDELLVRAQFDEKHERSEYKVKEIIIGKRNMNHIHYDIIEAYLNNYNEIVVYCNTPEEMATVKEFIGYMVALEVVQEDNKKVVAKDFLNNKDKEIDRTLRRIEAIVCSMLLDLKAVREDRSMADVIYERDYQVNRMGFLAMRIIHSASQDPSLASSIGLDIKSILRLWTTNIHLEKIGDECKRMGKFMAALDPKKYDTKELDRLIDNLIDLYKKTCTAIHTLDKDLLSSNIGRRKEIAITYENRTGKPIASPEIMSLIDQLLSHLADINRVYRYTGA